MSKIYVLVFILLLSGQNSQSAPQCSIPESSKWNMPLNALVETTENIIVAELESFKEVSEVSDIKPDFKPSFGIAADGRRNSSGKMKPLSLQGNVRWKFKIQKTLKGKLKANDEFSFVSLKISEDSGPRLTTKLCNYGLNFKVKSLYLIFVNSYNPNGYQQVSGINDPKIVEVEKLLKSK